MAAKRKSGAQPGNNNARKNEDWRRALDRVLATYSRRENKGQKISRVAKGQALEAIATKLIEQALGGDMNAIKEIGDRLDGKAIAHVEMTGKDDGPIETSVTVSFK